MKKFTFPDILLFVAAGLTVISWFGPAVAWHYPVVLIILALLLA